MNTPNKGAALFSDCEGFLNELSAADEAVLTGGSGSSSSSSSSGGRRRGRGGTNFVFVPFFVPYFPRSKKHGHGRYYC